MRLLHRSSIAIALFSVLALAPRWGLAQTDPCANPPTDPPYDGYVLESLAMRLDAVAQLYDGALRGQQIGPAAIRDAVVVATEAQDIYRALQAWVEQSHLGASLSRVNARHYYRMNSCATILGASSNASAFWANTNARACGEAAVAFRGVDSELHAAIVDLQRECARRQAEREASAPGSAPTTDGSSPRGGGTPPGASNSPAGAASPGGSRASAPPGEPHGSASDRRESTAAPGRDDPSGTSEESHGGGGRREGSAGPVDPNDYPLLRAQIDAQHRADFIAQQTQVVNSHLVAAAQIGMAAGQIQVGQGRRTFELQVLAPTGTLGPEFLIGIGGGMRGFVWFNNAREDETNYGLELAASGMYGVGILNPYSAVRVTGEARVWMGLLGVGLFTDGWFLDEGSAITLGPSLSIGMAPASKSTWMTFSARWLPALDGTTETLSGEFAVGINALLITFEGFLMKTNAFDYGAGFLADIGVRLPL